MTRTLWNVTFETVTQESAEQGDVSERGFLGQDLSFRDALKLFNDERDWTYIEADCDLRYPHVPGNAPRWLTDTGETQFASGDVRSVSLHIPDHITAASRYRLARYLGAL